MGAYFVATSFDDRKRSFALIALCLGVLLVAMNATAVNIALPSIRLDLDFYEASLAWIVNAYLVSYGGFLLFAARLGDLFGRRLLFLLGLSFFTLTSLGCGLAMSSGPLVVARIGQGLSGAVVSAVALAEIFDLFADASKRAKAMGIYVFVSTCGGSLGLLLGGALTSALSWRWVFFINVPVGAGIFALSATLLPRSGDRVERSHLDIAGAMTLTISLMLTVYAILNVRDEGWSSVRTLILFGGAGVLLALFIAIEARARTPLLPLYLFRIRNLTVMNIAGALLAAAVLSWNVIAPLYMQRVLRLSPLQVVLAFLPANAVIAGMSLVVAPTVVMRFGIRRPLVLGMLIVGGGLGLLARAPLSANIVLEVLPGMMLVGLGAGMAYNPLFLGALSGVPSRNSGVASGIVTTSLIMGAAIGLSIVAGIAASRTNDLVVAGTSLPLALKGGYQLAFGVSAVFATVAAMISGLFLCKEQEPRAD